MNITSSQQDKMEMILRQMGASVQSLHGILGYVRIEISEVTISYAYNINSKDQFFLQRIKPYPLGAGTFSTQKEVLDYIKQDIERFKQASINPSMTPYIDLNFKTHRLTHDLEEMFFNYSIDNEHIKILEDKIDAVKQEIDSIQAKSKQLHEVIKKF